MKTMLKTVFSASLALGMDAVVMGLENGVGRFPAMGVNTWNSLRCEGISAAAIKKIADRVVELGFKEKGYEYVNIDDCWSTTRDPTTDELVADPDAFPDGIKAVSDYVHSLGLKIGIYGDRGTLTCAFRPGSQGYEEVDAKTYAAWEIDYLKQDSCFASTDPKVAIQQYALMRDALNATGRPILYSLCGWNAWYAPSSPYYDYEGGASLGNSWRISSDSDDWEHIYAAVQTNAKLANFAKPGAFNDPDMLIGTQEDSAIFLGDRKSRAQFSLWAVLSAPLLLGNNLLLNISQHDLRTYLNEKAIAVNQDPGTPSTGIQGRLIFSNCPEWKILEQNNFHPWFYPIDKANQFLEGATIIVAALVAVGILIADTIGWKVCCFCCCSSSSSSRDGDAYELIRGERDGGEGKRQRGHTYVDEHLAEVPLVRRCGESCGSHGRAMCCESFYEPLKKKYPSSVGITKAMFWIVALGQFTVLRYID